MLCAGRCSSIVFQCDFVRLSLHSTILYEIIRPSFSSTLPHCEHRSPSRTRTPDVGRLALPVRRSVLTNLDGVCRYAGEPLLLNNVDLKRYGVPTVHRDISRHFRPFKAPFPPKKRIGDDRFYTFHSNFCCLVAVLAEGHSSGQVG